LVTVGVTLLFAGAGDGDFLAGIFGFTGGALVPTLDAQLDALGTF
jgi:hypothetical protein